MSFPYQRILKPYRDKDRANQLQRRLPKNLCRHTNATMLQSPNHLEKYSHITSMQTISWKINEERRKMTVERQQR